MTEASKTGTDRRIPAGVGVVFIGRNEGPRLGAALATIDPGEGRVVYVDSGSIDRSVEIAREAGVSVVALTDGPFTAARGRREGAASLQRSGAPIEFVQFVDGDCELAPGWLDAAAMYLTAHPRCGAVVGRLRERHPERSLWIRLIDAEWDLPTGETDAIGGISMIRLEAMERAGGWRGDLIAGEELDLATRLRGAGYTLHRLACDMCRHDIGITSFAEFWRRSVRTGHSYAQLSWLHGRRGPRRWTLRTAGHVFYGIALPALAIAGAILSPPVAIGASAVLVLLAARITLWRIRRGDPLVTACAYGLVLTVCKAAAGFGALKFWYSLATGRATSLIEYKRPAEGQQAARREAGATHA